MPTCGQASFIRAMPEKEKPPARRVDIYYVRKFNFLGHLDDILVHSAGKAGFAGKKQKLIN